jgi:hypothetical protein
MVNFIYIIYNNINKTKPSLIVGKVVFNIHLYKYTLHQNFNIVLADIFSPIICRPYFFSLKNLGISVL